MSGTSRRIRRWAAIALLGVMCVGSGTHFLHHLFDRNCDPDGRHGSVPCTACSMLHRAAVTPQAEISAPRAPSVATRLAVAQAAEPEARQLFSGTPRAPPAS